jgi:hypothetical protein
VAAAPAAALTIVQAPQNIIMDNVLLLYLYAYTRPHNAIQAVLPPASAPAIVVVTDAHSIHFILAALAIQAPAPAQEGHGKTAEDVQASNSTQAARAGNVLVLSVQGHARGACKIPTAPLMAGIAMVIYEKIEIIIATQATQQHHAPANIIHYPAMTAHPITVELIARTVIYYIHSFLSGVEACPLTFFATRFQVIMWYVLTKTYVPEGGTHLAVVLRPTTQRPSVLICVLEYRILHQAVARTRILLIAAMFMMTAPRNIV